MTQKFAVILACPRSHFETVLHCSRSDGGKLRRPDIIIAANPVGCGPFLPTPHPVHPVEHGTAPASSTRASIIRNEKIPGVAAIQSYLRGKFQQSFLVEEICTSTEICKIFRHPLPNFSRVLCALANSKKHLKRLTPEIWVPSTPAREHLCLFAHVSSVIMFCVFSPPSATRCSAPLDAITTAPMRLEKLVAAAHALAHQHLDAADQVCIEDFLFGASGRPHLQRWSSNPK